MILLLGSQIDMNAQRRFEPDHKRPGIERTITKNDIERLQDFYWDRYRVRLTKKEAEKILLIDGKHKMHRGPGHNGPQRPPTPPNSPRPPRK